MKKNTYEIIDYIETELKVIALEDLEIKDTDTAREIKYKTTQLGKHVALEKLLAFINNTHNTAFPPRKRSQAENKEVSEDKRRPIIVCK